MNQTFKGSPYPNRIEVLGADFGFVADNRYECSSDAFFDKIREFEKNELKRTGTGKIAVKEISIEEHDEDYELHVELWDTDGTFTYRFKKEELAFKRATCGGNLNNIMRNWDVLFEILHKHIENKPDVNFYAVGDEECKLCAGFEHIKFNNIQGKSRQAYIFNHSNTGDMVSFVIPRALLKQEHHINNEMPHEAAYFMVGNHPYTSRGHLEFLVDHIEKYPESKIFFIPSTIQINDGYDRYEYFMEKVYLMACNLNEAYRFLGINDPIVNPERCAEKAAIKLHNMGVKRVVISHGTQGMFCSTRTTKLSPSCQNWDPIIDIESLLLQLPSHIKTLDEKGTIPIRRNMPIDVTGCGDAFTSGVFLYDVFNQNNTICDEMVIAKYLAALKAVYPYSNLKGIHKKLLKFVIDFAFKEEVQH